jgi:DNA-binding transcriptional LysR family regulator
MQLQQIKYFLLLCEELSFTRAAQRCNVAQPTLTKAMRSLERELGGPLFRRRPVELSALGKAIRPYGADRLGRPSGAPGGSDPGAGETGRCVLSGRRALS